MTPRRALFLLLPLFVVAAFLVGSMPLHTGSAVALPTKVEQPVQPPMAPPEADDCAVKEAPVYYTKDANKESEHAYGTPVAPTNLDLVHSVFDRRTCGYLDVNEMKWYGGDWALLASLKSEVDGTDRNHRYASIDEWAAALNEFRSRIIWNPNQARLYLAVGEVRVETFYMVVGHDNVPTVYQTSKLEPISDYLLLPVRRHDGTVVNLFLRLKCGFQPVHLKEKIVLPG